MTYVLNRALERPLYISLTEPNGFGERDEIMEIETRNQRYAVGRSTDFSLPYLSSIEALSCGHQLVAIGNIHNSPRYADATSIADNTSYQTSQIVSVTLRSGEKLDTTTPGTRFNLVYGQEQHSALALLAGQKHKQTKQLHA